MNALSTSQTVVNLSVVPLLMSKNILISPPSFVANCLSCCRLVFSLHRPTLPFIECKSICSSTGAWSVIAITPILQSTTQSTSEPATKNSLFVNRIFESENKMCIPVLSDL